MMQEGKDVLKDGLASLEKIVRSMSDKHENPEGQWGADQWKPLSNFVQACTELLR